MPLVRTLPLLPALVFLLFQGRLPGSPPLPSPALPRLPRLGRHALSAPRTSAVWSRSSLDFPLGAEGALTSRQLRLPGCAACVVISGVRFHFATTPLPRDLTFLVPNLGVALGNWIKSAFLTVARLMFSILLSSRVLLGGRCSVSVFIKAF